MNCSHSLLEVLGLHLAWAVQQWILKLKGYHSSLQDCAVMRFFPGKMTPVSQVFQLPDLEVIWTPNSQCRHWEARTGKR